MVTVSGDDGAAEMLPPRNEVRNHSPDGFEWGYSGSGPAQLPLAILLDHVEHDPGAVEVLRRIARDEEATAGELVMQCYQRFKGLVIAGLDQDAVWELTTADVQEALQALADKRAMGRRVQGVPTAEVIR